MHLSIQNNRYWSSETPRLTHKVSLYDIRFCAWSAVRATRITGLFSRDNSNIYTGQIPTQLLACACLSVFACVLPFKLLNQ
jgi:hypothetical protein